MRGSKRWIADPVMMRMSILACALALAVALWPSAAVSQGTHHRKAEAESVTDDGEGKIKVVWSFGEDVEGQTPHPVLPSKICAYWNIKGEKSRHSPDCTNDISEDGGPDLVFDSGIAEDTEPDVTSATYVVVMTTNYTDPTAPGYPLAGSPTEVTVNKP